MTWLLGRARNEGTMPDRFYWVEEMRILQADFDEWVQRQSR